MSQTLSCPVCGRQGLPADCVSCPQCDSDLTCFQVLEALYSNNAAPDAPPAQKKARRFPWLALLSGAVLLLLLAMLAAEWRSRMPGLHHVPLTSPATAETAQDQQAALHEKTGTLSDGKIHIDAQIRILDDRQERERRQAAQQAAIEEKNQADSPAQESVAADLPEKTKQDNEDSSVPEPQTVELPDSVAKQAVAANAAPPAALPVLQGRRKRAVRIFSGLRDADEKSAKQKNSKSTFVHHAQDGETVWELAEQFYGEGKYYPVIMELNPHIVQGRVRGSGNVRLLADRRQAAALYQRRTEERDGLLLWKHKVQPGETWQSIYARFFPPRYSGMVFYPGDQKVVPGSMVRIVLR